MGGYMSISHFLHYAICARCLLQSLSSMTQPCCSGGFSETLKESARKTNLREKLKMNGVKFIEFKI